MKRYRIYVVVSILVMLALSIALGQLYEKCETRKKQPEYSGELFYSALVSNLLIKNQLDEGKWESARHLIDEHFAFILNNKSSVDLEDPQWENMMNEIAEKMRNSDHSKKQ